MFKERRQSGAHTGAPKEEEGGGVWMEERKSKGREDDGRWSEGRLRGGGGMNQARKGRCAKEAWRLIRESQFHRGAPAELVKHLRREKLSQGYASSRQVANVSPSGGISSKKAWVSGGSFMQHNKQ